MKTLKMLLLYCCMAVVSTSAFAKQDHTCQGGHNCNTTPSPAPSVPSTSSSSTSDSSSSSQSLALSQSSSSALASQKQGQGQSQGQGQTANGGNATAQSTGGNNSNNSTSNTLVQRNTPMAYAPEAIPSAPCVKGYSAGASGPAFGATFGAGKVDQECEIRETARAFALGGSRISYCKVLITTKAAKRAGVTLGECMDQSLPSVAEVAAPAVPEVVEPAPPAIIVIPVGLPLQTPPVVLPVQPTVKPKAVARKKAVAVCKEQEK